MRLGFTLISRNLDLSLSAPKCNYNIAIALARLGADVEILTSNVNLSKHDYDKLVNAGVKIRMMPKLFARRALSPIMYSITAKLYKDDRIVIGNGYTLGDDITWVHFLRLQALRNLPEIVDTRTSAKMRWEILVEKVILKSSNFLWAVSSLVKRSLVEDYGIPEEKIFVLHNGVDMEKYNMVDDEERRKLRKMLGIDEDTIVFTFVGADPYRKGFDKLLKALKNVKIRNYIVLAVGFIPDTNILNMSMGLNTRFLGKIEEDHLVKIYNITDFMVLLSRYDPFSLVTLEAMASGAIPIVSPMVGASEIIEHGVNGFVIVNEDELVELLETINRASLKDLRRRARETALKYSWTNIASNLIHEISNRLKYLI
ncbi:MAG: glycosyltransferase family 4 protein [Infirmifilum sp.]